MNRVADSLLFPATCAARRAASLLVHARPHFLTGQALLKCPLPQNNMNKLINKLLTLSAFFTVLVFGANTVTAENEPSDNTFAGASEIIISGEATGFLPSGDVDFYQITNTAGFSAIEIHYIFEGSGPDTHRMRVFGPDSTVNELSNQTTSAYQATYTIADGPADATYFISVQKQTADGTLPYTLTVNGSFAEIDLAAKSVTNDGETYDIEVSSGASWEVTDIPAWVSVSPTSGTNDEILTVVIQPNPFLTREAVINIGGVFHTITQTGNTGSTDNEPADNTISGATTMLINSVATGSISNSDTDYFTFVKPAGSSSITVDFLFSGSGPDTHRMRVLGPSSQVELFNELTGSSGELRYRARFEVEDTLAFETSYIVCIEGNSSGGTNSYNLTVTGTSTSIDQATKSIPNTSGSYTVVVTSNTFWSVTDLPAWAIATPTSGSGVGSVQISHEANTESTERVATILIGGQSHMLTQAAAEVGVTPTWTPEGWVYFNWPYAYSFNGSSWHFFAANGTQQRVNLSTNIWEGFDQASGWNYFTWPYSYSFDESRWYFHNRGESILQWVIEVTSASAVWSLIGD